MPTLRSILAALGGGGAVRNVETVLDRRAHEEHAVEVLVERIGAPAPTRTSRTTAA